MRAKQGHGPACSPVAEPNGPLPKEMIEMYPNAPFIKRNGEVNAWVNPDFRKAVEARGRKQVVLGGIVTEVYKYFRTCVGHGGM